jgi:hypothetical protein
MACIMKPNVLTDAGNSTEENVIYNQKITPRSLMEVKLQLKASGDRVCNL